MIGDSHKGETLYLWKTSSGLIWKGFGDKENHPKYEGDVENGKPNGVGIINYLYGDKYVVEWKDGLYNGQGTETIYNGWKYKGEWKDGERRNGTLYDKEGKIIGKFMNGWFDQ